MPIDDGELPSMQRRVSIPRDVELAKMPLVLVDNFVEHTGRMWDLKQMLARIAQVLVA